MQHFPSLCHQQIPDDIIEKWNICNCLPGKLRNAQSHPWSLCTRQYRGQSWWKWWSCHGGLTEEVIQRTPRQAQASRSQRPEWKLPVFSGLKEGWCRRIRLLWPLSREDGHINLRRLPCCEKDDNLQSVTVSQNLTLHRLALSTKDVGKWQLRC